MQYIVETGRESMTVEADGFFVEAGGVVFWRSPNRKERQPIVAIAAGYWCGVREVADSADKAAAYAAEDRGKPDGGDQGGAGEEQSTS